MEKTQKSPKKQTGIRLTPETVRELKYLAADLERSLSSIVEEAVKEYLEKYKKTPKP